MTKIYTDEEIKIIYDKMFKQVKEILMTQNYNGWVMYGDDLMMDESFILSFTDFDYKFDQNGIVTWARRRMDRVELLEQCDLDTFNRKIRKIPGNISSELFKDLLPVWNNALPTKRVEAIEKAYRLKFICEAKLKETTKSKDEKQEEIKGINKKDSSFMPIKNHVKKNTDLGLSFEEETLKLYKLSGSKRVLITRDRSELFGKEASVLWMLLNKFTDSAGGRIFTEDEKVDKNQISRLNKILYTYYGLPEERPIKNFVFRDGKEIEVTHGFFKYKKGDRSYYRSEIQLEKSTQEDLINMLNNIDKSASPSDHEDHQRYFGRVDTSYSDKRYNGDDDSNNS